MSKKKVTYEKSTEVLDKETGEVTLVTREQTSMIEREPDYVKLYIGDIMRLNELPPATGKVMIALLKSMGYNNIIPAYAPIKRMICRDLGITMNTINKAIDNLVKKELLIRFERGMYLADPNLFGRGKWADIKEIRTVITYNEEGKKEIKAEVKKDQLSIF